MPWKFASMELSDEEKLDMDMPMPMPDRPKFPYGLRISLSESELDKLKIKDLPGVGDLIDLRAMSRVTNVSCEELEGGKRRCRVELQIEQLACENENEEATPAPRVGFRKAMYATDKA